jgi:ectoine hydroxylase-related dioxygenase (phytanoyl-CoA dioxygenase family)
MNRGTQFVIDKIEDIVQISRIVWAGAAEPELLNISRQDKLLRPVSQLLGSKEADQLINQLHYKLPHDKLNFYWHQDVHNRRNFDPEWQDLNGKGSFVQSFIAIDPMSIENGTIFILPQSVKYGEISQHVFHDRLATILTSEKIIPLLLNPGDVVLMHPYLIHGSFPNESEKSRIILINGFAYPGANTKAYPGVGCADRIKLVDELIDI